MPAITSQLGSGSPGAFALGLGGSSPLPPPATVGPGIVIAGVDRSGYLDKTGAGKGGTSSWMVQTNARGSANITLRIHAGDAWAGPQCGNPISVYDQLGHRVFGGLIFQLDWMWEGDTNEQVVTCTCASFEAFLDKHLDTQLSFFDQTADVIFTALFNAVALGETITLGTVQVGPNVPNIVFDGGALLTAAFDKLATDSGFVWGVDPDTEKLYFKAPTLTPAPFQLTGPTGGAGATVLFDTIKWTTTQQDFRDQQRIRINLEAFSPDTDLVQGDGVTNNFSVRFPLNTLKSVVLVNSTRAQVSGTATGNFSPGDTVTIDAITYTFVSTLDNTVPFQVRIGATAHDSLNYLAEALTGAPSAGQGVDYSLPTWGNRACAAPAASGNTITLFSKQLGTNQSSSRRHFVAPPGVVVHAIPVSAASATFSWASGTLTGATNGVDTTLQIGVLGVDSQKDAWWNPGSNSIIFTVAPGAGQFVAITYFRLGQDIISVENSTLVAARAAIEGGTGRWVAIMDSTRDTDPVAFDPYGAVAKAVAQLTSYGLLPETLEFQTDYPGLQIGMDLTVNLPSPFATQLNGTWQVQKLQGDYIPGMPGWRYTVDVIASRSSPPAAIARKGTSIRFWEKLAELGTARNPTSSLGQGSGGGPSGSTFIPAFELNFGLNSQPVAVQNNDTTNAPAVLEAFAISNWRFTAPFGAPAGTSFTCDVYLNGSVLFTVTVAAGTTDLTGTFTRTLINPGDHVYGKCTNAASTVAPSIAVY